MHEHGHFTDEAVRSWPDSPCFLECLLSYYDMDENRRRFTRVVAAFPVEIAHGRECFNGRIIDLSMNGLFVKEVPTIPEKEDVDISIELQSGDNSIMIKAEAVVIRSGERGTALRFKYIHGEDSYEHLRKVILYNSGNPDSALDELLHNNWSKSD